jgi:hypothetical protein
VVPERVEVEALAAEVLVARHHGRLRDDVAQHAQAEDRAGLLGRDGALGEAVEGAVRDLEYLGRERRILGHELADVRGPRLGVGDHLAHLAHDLRQGRDVEALRRELLGARGVEPAGGRDRCAGSGLRAGFHVDAWAGGSREAGCGPLSGRVGARA